MLWLCLMLGVTIFSELQADESASLNENDKDGKQIIMAFIKKRCLTNADVNAYAELEFQQHDYKLDFERAEALRYNESYLKQWHVVTFKYNRTFAAVNMTFEFKVDIGHDLEIITQAYKFASNEYRVFPIRFEMNYCQAITKDIGGLQAIYKCGNFTGCSFLKGKPVKACNWIPNTGKFPPLIPNGQYMVEFQGMHNSTEIFVLRGYATVSRPIPIPKD